METVFKVSPFLMVRMSHERKSVRIDFMVTPEDNRFIERLVSSGTYKNRSEVMRKALEDFMAKYTGVSTLSSLDEQVKRLRFRCDGYEEELRTIRRQIKELEEAES